MVLTARDITMNADAFRAAYPSWPNPEPERSTTVQLSEIVPGDGIDAPFWPYRVAILDIRKPLVGQLARVSWSSPDADGITSLSLRALVRRTWDFRSQATMPAFDPGPSPIGDALQAMTAAQHDAGIGGPFDDYDADATMAALLEDF